MSTATVKQSAQWFNVDRDGLRAILSRKHPSFILYELISNCWDTSATSVHVTLTTSSTRGRCDLTIRDDDPNGFSDLSHAYTLYAPSTRKGDATKRGRFNLGEKLALALCAWAEIASTSGSVYFTKDGRTEDPRSHTDKGSIFTAEIYMTKQEMNEALSACNLLLPPIPTYINDLLLPTRPSVLSFTATLPSVLSDEEGNLRPTSRRTTIELFSPLPGESAILYELGVPVVETDDEYSCNVRQKVPLNADRDNVTPAYLRRVRTLILDNTHSLLTPDTANATWVKEAVSSPDISVEAVKSVVTQRFGDKVVSYDPSDPEANKVAVAAGYTVVHGRSLSSDEWANVRRAEAILPAGRVTPSNSKVVMNAVSEAGQSTIIPPSSWAPGMIAISAYAQRLAIALISSPITVEMHNAFTVPAAAWYGGKRMGFNLARLGHKWFSSPDQQKVDELILHELAHDRVSDHLDHDFANEVGRLGAKLANMIRKGYGDTLSLPLPMPNAE